MIKVMIVRDQSIVSEGLRMLLSSASDIEVVGEAANEDEAITLAAAPGVCVALVDADMGDAIGLRAAADPGYTLPKR